MSNALLRALSRSSSAQPAYAGYTPWSVLYAGIPAGTDLSIGNGVKVVYDLTNSPDYGYITHETGSFFAVDNTKATRLSCKGRLRMTGSTFTASPTYNNPHTVNYYGPRSDEPAASIALATALNATPSYIRGDMGMAGADRRILAELPVTIQSDLRQTFAPGDTTLRVAVSMTVRAGWKIFISTSMYPSQAAALGLAQRGGQTVTVTANYTGLDIPVTAGATGYTHYGYDQYFVPARLEQVSGTNLSIVPYDIQNSDTFGTTASGSVITGVDVLEWMNYRSPGSTRFILNNKARCAILTRCYNVTGPQDSDRTVHGYGPTEMDMGNAIAIRQGIHVQDGGKAGQLGAYPQHDHIASVTRYGTTGSGTVLADVDPTLRNIVGCVTTNSSNRSISCHATNGGRYWDNVAINTDTTAMLAGEDGSERRNSWKRNFVSGVNYIGYGKNLIKQWDRFQNGGTLLNEMGPAGFFFTNPDQPLEDNFVSAAPVGIWHSFAHYCFGASRDVAIRPFDLMVLSHKNNRVIGVDIKAAATGVLVTDELGNTNDDDGGFGYQYKGFTPAEEATAAALSGGLFNNIARPTFSNFNFAKSDLGLYGNNVLAPHYDRGTFGAVRKTASGAGTFHEEDLGVFGNTSSGDFDGCAYFTKTLDDYYSNDTPVQFLSYGASVAFKHLLSVGAKIGAYYRAGGTSKVVSLGGQQSWWDLYVFPVNYGYTLNVKNLYLGADPGSPGMRFPPNFMAASFDAAFVAAGGTGTPYQTRLGTPQVPWSQGMTAAVLLPDKGYFGMPAGSWWAFDHPAVLYGTVGGKTYAPAAVGDTNLNGVLLNNSNYFYGVQINQASGVDVVTKAIQYFRLQSDGVTVVPNSDWNTGAPSAAYGNMRHASVPNAGWLAVTWLDADVTNPTSLQLTVFGHVGGPSGGHFFLRSKWSGGTAVNFAGSGTGSSKILSLTSAGFEYSGAVAAASVAACAASTSTSYFVDTANNWIYCHFINFTATAYPAGSVDPAARSRSTGVYINSNP